MFKFLYRVIRYVKIHLFKDPIYLLYFALYYFHPGYIPRIKYSTIDDLKSALEQGKSIIRIGDGEVFMLNGEGLPAQKYHKELRDLMYKTVTNYTSNSPYILCLNKLPLSKSNAELRRNNLLPCWLPSKVYFNLYFRKGVEYYDAAMFYRSDTIPKYFESYLMKKKLILISNAENIEKFKANTSIPFGDVFGVETQRFNAFDEYDLIKDKIRARIVNENISDFVVIAACGPAGKGLAYEFSKEGLQFIDIGQGIEIAYSNSNLYDNVFKK